MWLIQCVFLGCGRLDDEASTSTLFNFSCVF